MEPRECTIMRQIEELQAELQAIRNGDTMAECGEAVQCNPPKVGVYQSLAQDMVNVAESDGVENLSVRVGRYKVQVYSR